MEDGEPERLDRLEEGQHGPLARGRAPRRAGLDLKVDEQVVGEHDQVLPRTVGRIGHRGHGVEGQACLELRDRLLVVTATAGEGPEVCEGQIERRVTAEYS